MTRRYHHRGVVFVATGATPALAPSWAIAHVCSRSSSVKLRRARGTIEAPCVSGVGGRETVDRLLDAIASVGRNAALPYGYTATVWATGAAVADRLDPPGLPDALAYVTGAWLAFVILRLLVQGREEVADQPGTRRTVRMGVLQIVPVATAVLAGVGVGAALGLVGPLAWGIAGCLATFVFLSVASLDLALLPE